MELQGKVALVTGAGSGIGKATALRFAFMRKGFLAMGQSYATGFIRADPAKAGCRGLLAAQSLKPQAVTLAESRGIACVAVDLAVLRGEREPELTLFA